MKLTKISLAALVALGAFSTVASATPLEEAIKNVDFSGFARHRYTTTKSGVDSNTKTSAGNEFKFIGTFKAVLDDNFFGVLGLTYKTIDNSGKTIDSSDGSVDKTKTEEPFKVREFYLGYKRGNTTITAGKQLIGTFFDDDLTGTGLRIVNSDIEGLTLAAVAFDALDKGSEVDILTPAISIHHPAPTNLKDGLGNNLYGLAAMGSYNPISFKLWWASLVDVANLYAFDAAAKFDMDAVKLGLQGQYVHSKVDSDLKPEFSNTNFYAVKADIAAMGAKFNAGYINYKTKDNMKRGFVTIEDNGKLINPARVLNGAMNGQYYHNITDENKFFFVGAGYDVDKLGFGLNYIGGKGYSYGLKKEDAKRKEINGQISYKYSKKLDFLAWYAAAKDSKDGVKFKYDRFRFQTVYKF
ncbi:major outer membrane protein [Campylobacter sp. MOP7]|uniref:major outer membrane protein n=1 Tax=Campylobacter canis TaxID=3378588 RepID=UPI00387E4231